METEIDISAFPNTPSSNDWDVPKKIINSHSGHPDIVHLSTATKTELGAIIKKAAVEFRDVLQNDPSMSVQALHATLRRWKDTRTSNIQPMALEWFQHFDLVQVAAGHDRIDLVQALIEQGLKLGEGSAWIMSMRTAKTGDVSNLQYLVDHGWDINKPVGIRKEAILSLVTNNEDAVKWCLKNGADPNGTSQRDFTVLHYAAKNASLPIIQLLLEAGGNISPSSRSAGVIAHAAEAHSETSDRKPIIQYFINNGADINGLYVQCNGRDRSPLSLWQNQTALHVAVVRGHQPLVEFLLERGADKSIQTKTPASAFKWMSVEELAEKHRRKELVQFFREGTNSTL